MSVTCAARSTGRSGWTSWRQSAAPVTGCGCRVRRAGAEQAMSLRLRLALLFATGTLAVITVAGLAFLGQLHASLNAALDATLQPRAAALARQVARAKTPPRPGKGSV